MSRETDDLPDVAERTPEVEEDLEDLALDEDYALNPEFVSDVADAIVWPLAEQTVKAIGRELLDEADRLTTEADTAKEDGAKALRKAASHAKAKAEQIQSRRKVQDLLAVARTRPGIQVRPQQLDAIVHLFSVANGTIDLRTGKLLRHDPAHLITQCSPVAYDPRVKRDLLQRVLDNLAAHVPGRDTDDTKNENQENWPIGTLSASALMQRRVMKPRKNSSSAIGTVTVDPARRKSSQIVCHGWLKCRGFWLTVAAAEAAAAPGVRSIQIANATAPMRTASGEMRHVRQGRSCRRYQSTAAVAITLTG
jgi:hypothetical protein